MGAPRHRDPRGSARAGWLVLLGLVAACSGASEPPTPLARATVGAVVGPYTDGSCMDLALSPDGRRAYYAIDWDLAVLDVDPASSTYESVVARYALPSDWIRTLAPSPDGATLWVGGEALWALDASTGEATFVTSVAAAGLLFVEAIAPSADGSTLFVSDGFRGARLDVVGIGSATIAASLPAMHSGVRGPGELALAAGGHRLFEWTTVVDVEPGSATRDTEVGRITSTPGAFASQPVAAPGGAAVYAVRCPSTGVDEWACFLQAYDPVTLTTLGGATLASHLAPGPMRWALAPTPDGADLLALEYLGAAAPELRVLRTADLAERARWSLPVPVGGVVSRLTVTPDGSRAYARLVDVGKSQCLAYRIQLR